MTYRAPSRNSFFFRASALLLLIGVVLLMPRQAKASVADIIAYLQSITSTLQKEIGETLSQMQLVESEIANTRQQLVWPTAAIAQAKSLAQGMQTRYVPAFQAIIQLPIGSGTLPVSSNLENVIRSRSVLNLRQTDQLYKSVYSQAPAATDAAPSERNIIDMDDAFALASLKQATASDQNSTQLLNLASSLEQRASVSAPGSAIYLNVEAQLASLHNQAQDLKILAAELRVEAGSIAHDNAVLKKRAINAHQLRMDLQNILTRSK